jgi:hypothetical protein
MRLYIASNTRHLHWRIFEKEIRAGKGRGRETRLGWDIGWKRVQYIIERTR